MFLLDVRVQGGVTQVSLWAVAALEVASLNIVFRSTLALVGAIFVSTALIVVVPIVLLVH